MKFTGERVVIGDMKNYIPTLQEHIARYNFALQPATGKLVLDVACGTGYGTKLLSEAAGAIMGADISKESVEYASKLYPDLSFVECDLDNQWPGQEYDLCVSFETIEHLHTPEFFLQNVATNCKEFLFSIPVNNPSKYHIQVWNKDQIFDMISKYWNDITWFNQTGFSIFQGHKDATFLIGMATNSKFTI